MHMRAHLLLGVLSVVIFGSTGYAQCPDCVPDTGCSVSPAYPTLCPTAPPDATAGEPYSADITFWLPPTFTDPGTGFTVDFVQMTITSIAGLPFGLDIETSEPGGVYYPQQQQYGCARICGTPLGAGTYTITIDIIAGVTYSGIPINSPQQFSLLLTVVPGSGGNSSFTFSPTTGCGSVVSEFHALIDGAPSPTSYLWDLGNGSTSDLPDPPAQTYPGPGTYVITLQTTIGGYILDQVDLTGTNDNWCGDVEEPNIPLVGCTGSPDPYFVLTDGNGGTYTSSTMDNTTTATWSGLGLLLDNPPYSLTFYDEDPVSQNDQLGTYNIPNNGSGQYFINVSGGTTGSLSITEQVQQSFSDADTIVVFPVPELQLNADPVSGELCTPNDSLVSYVWFLDGDTVPGASGPCFQPTGAGLWTVMGTNGYGCSGSSEAAVVCPTLTIGLNGNVLFVPSGFSTYSWTYNGSPAGTDVAFVLAQGDGLYAVTITDGNGCEVTAEFNLVTAGIPEPVGTATRVQLHPVPNTGEFTVLATGLRGPAVQVRVSDMTGRVVHEQRAIVDRGELRAQVSFTGPSGAYVVQVIDQGQVHVARMVVR